MKRCAASDRMLSCWRDVALPRTVLIAFVAHGLILEKDQTCETTRN